MIIRSWGTRDQWFTEGHEQFEMAPRYGNYCELELPVDMPLQLFHSCFFVNKDAGPKQSLKEQMDKINESHSSPIGPPPQSAAEAASRLMKDQTDHAPPFNHASTENLDELKNRTHERFTKFDIKCKEAFDKVDANFKKIEERVESLEENLSVIQECLPILLDCVKFTADRVMNPKPKKSQAKKKKPKSIRI